MEIGKGLQMILVSGNSISTFDENTHVSGKQTIRRWKARLIQGCPLLAPH